MSYAHRVDYKKTGKDCEDEVGRVKEIIVANDVKVKKLDLVVGFLRGLNEGKRLCLWDCQN